MKKLIMTCVLAALLGVFNSPARAVVWTFTLETFDPAVADIEISPDPIIEPDAAQYDYSWDITEASVQVDVDTGQWIPILTALPPEESGSGTADRLPITIFGGSSDPLHVDVSIGPVSESSIIAEIDHLAVLDTGHAAARLTPISFGQADLGGDIGVVDVTGVRFTGELSVVPEPMTVLLLGLGSLVIVARRRTLTKP